jgi:Protein kinase domain
LQADQGTKEIRFRGKLFWSEDWRAEKSCPVGIPEGYLSYEAAFLIEEEGGTLRPERLRELVRGLDGSYPEGAEFAAAAANQDRPRVQFLFGQTDRFLQLYVFQCINALFFCFNPTLSVAGSKVSSGLCCSKLITTEANREVEKINSPFTCMPDGAVVANQKSFVLAAMELNNEPTGILDSDDMFNCVFLTSMTAVALVERRVADKVLVPFVVNVGEVAYLFAAYKEKGKQHPPVIQRLAVSRFYLRAERVELVALLAVLLHKLTELMDSEKGRDVTDSIRQIMNQSSGRSRSSRSEGGGGPRPKKQQDISTEASGRSRTGRGRQEEAGTGGEAAIGARAVAECDGRLAGLVVYNEVDSGSPYYFWGERSAPSSGSSTSAVAAASPVFVKVWREGDDRTSLEAIESEMELLQQAHRSGVPCPHILPELTERSVTCKRSGDGYHRLVMERLADHRIEPRDLEAFALSLVAAVQRLHRAAGILHCDIKPSNVLWNSATKTAYLVDFGHAQREEGAIPYTGTVGYTCPEVERRLRPHSRRSDAYSVGKTIRTVLDRSGGGTARHRLGHDDDDRLLERVAELLARPNPDDRISLDDALQELLLRKPSGSGTGSGPSGERGRPVRVRP